MSLSSTSSWAVGRSLRTTGNVQFRGFQLGKKIITVKCGLSGDFLSSVATFALQTRLASYDLVETKIDCSFGGLLQGQVKGVQIRGQSWQSPLMLTCRTLEVSVSSVRIDVQNLISNQLISLLEPPLGNAVISFNGKDFENFLSHPLVVEQSKTAIENRPFIFSSSGGTQILGPNESPFKKPVVLFSGIWEENGKLYHLAMGSKENDPFSVDVWLSGESAEGDDLEAQKVVNGIKSFFQHLCVELNGTFMTFSSLKFVPFISTSGSTEWVMQLELKVVVRSFPPPKVTF